MRKLTSLLMLLCMFVGTAWGQVNQKVPHSRWTVTAPNQSVTSGNEGGVAFIKDENPKTFYHSDWGTGQPGKDGLQGFLIDMAEEIPGITKITYTGRSDNKTSGWARGVKIYLYTALPDGLPADLSTVAHADKNTLFENAAVLGDPAFDNTASPWGDNRNLKTAEFAEAKTARYVLFVMHSGHDSWLTCADFHVYQKVEGIVEDKPYFLKITNAKAEGEWYLDTYTPIADNNGNTIGRSSNKVATYFTMSDGYWRISTDPKAEGNFVSVQTWNAQPQESVADGWTIEMNSDGTILLKQHEYFGNSNSERTYLGGDVISNSGVVKVYTDNSRDKAIKIQLVELTDVEAAKESARLTLAKVGVGYPAVGSEARTTLQAAVDAADATAETINAAITTYNAVTDVVLPEAGKVYRIISANPKFFSNQKVRKAIYSNGNSELRWNTLDNSAMNQLWTVEGISDLNITLFNVNDASYPQSSSFSSSIRNLNVKNECKLEFLGSGQFKVMANKSQGIHANGHGNGTGNEGNAINYNTGANDASAWYLEEVTVTKNILAAQINSIKTAYLGSMLIKPEGLAGLQDAVDAAQAVHDANGNYAEAFSELIAAVKSASLEYIDLGYFRMKAKESNKYAYYDGNDLKTQATANLKSIFKLSKSVNGKFYVQNANGLYAQSVAQSTIVKNDATPLEYNISKLASGHYVLRPANLTGTHQFWHQSGSSEIVGWETAAGNTQWEFEALSNEEVAKIYTVNLGAGANAYITYTGTYDGGDKDVKNTGGFYLLNEAPDVNDFTLNGADEGLNIQISVEGKNIFAGVSGKNVYIIRSFGNNAYARYHSGCTLSENDETNMLTFENNNLHWESLFFIEKGTGDYVDYYTIRPVSAPTLYVYNLKTDNANSTVATKEKPAYGDLTTNYYWKISTFGSEYGNITPYGGDAYGWNKRGSYGGYNHIGYWQGQNHSNDNKWQIRTLEEELIPHTVDNSVLGYVTYETVQSQLANLRALNSTALNTLKNTQFEVVAPKVGTFYRLKNTVSNRYMTAEAEAVKVYDACDEKSTIFYVDEENTLLSYAFGRYLDNSAKKLANVGAKYSGLFAKKCGASYLPNVLAYKNNSCWTFGNKANGVSIDRGSGNQPSDEGYNWTFEKVTSLPVTITAAGYATFFAPVAVEIPEGVKAYYTAEVDGEYIIPTEIEGIIPANTGVILKGEAKTYNLTIAENVEAVSGNMLAGTVASTYIVGDGYVLAKPADSQVGFYLAEKNQQSNSAFLNNGFKAYLPASVFTAGARFLVFDFGTETGIIETENGNVKTENVDIYDLSGRRVQKAQKGIFIVNGKKVIR